MNRGTVSSLTLLLIAGNAAAMDTRFTDIRLGIGAAETPDKAHVKYDAGGYSAAPSSRRDVGFEHSIGGRIRIGLVHGRTTSWGGWFAGTGIELSGQRLELEGAGDDADFDNTSSSSVRAYAEGGYAYAFNKRFHLEIGPTVGAGASSITWVDQQDDGRWTSETGSGTSLAIGGRLGLYARVGSANGRSLRREQPTAGASTWQGDPWPDGPDGADWCVAVDRLPPAVP